VPQHPFIISFLFYFYFFVVLSGDQTLALLMLGKGSSTELPCPAQNFFFSFFGGAGE
jgi:hypothetical protein